MGKKTKRSKSTASIEDENPIPPRHLYASSTPQAKQLEAGDVALSALGKSPLSEFSASQKSNDLMFSPLRQSEDSESCPLTRSKDLELSQLGKSSELPHHGHNTGTMSRYVTMTGTITRGRKAGQIVEVQMEVTENEYDKMYSADNSSSSSKSDSDCLFGIKKGPHVFFLSVLCIPIALLCSVCATFYYGCVTWYNIYIYLYEEKTIWHKIFLCPLVLLSFPLTVALPSLFVGLFAMFVQISWFWRSWVKEFTDFEKGLYGWICNKLDLTDCCPYEVILLDEQQPALPTTAPGRTTATTSI